MLITKVIGVALARKLRGEGVSTLHTEFLVRGEVIYFVGRSSRAALSFLHADIDVGAVRVARGLPVRSGAHTGVDLALLADHLDERGIDGEQEVRWPTQVVEVETRRCADACLDQSPRSSFDKRVV